MVRTMKEYRCVGVSDHFGADEKVVSVQTMSPWFAAEIYAKTLFLTADGGSWMYDATIVVRVEWDDAKPTFWRVSTKQIPEFKSEMCDGPDGVKA